MLVGIVEPHQELVGDVGWIDLSAGVRACERANGEILLPVEDSWAQKQLVYRPRHPKTAPTLLPLLGDGP
jgi:hypothetical protein